MSELLAGEDAVVCPGGELSINASHFQPVRHLCEGVAAEGKVRHSSSRYVLASPCDGLSAISEDADPPVFIDKHCDVAATSKARHLRPELERNLRATIAFWCAGIPSTRQILKMLG